VVRFNILIVIIVQVILHCTTRTMDGIIVNSTRREHGGDAISLSTFHHYVYYSSFKHC